MIFVNMSIAMGRLWCTNQTVHVISARSDRLAVSLTLEVFLNSCLLFLYLSFTVCDNRVLTFAKAFAMFDLR